MEDQKTAADVERLQHTLGRERAAHRETKRTLIAIERDLRVRVAELEARPQPASMAQITAGLAEIRADLRATVAEVRQELDHLEQELHTFTRA